MTQRDYLAALAAAVLVLAAKVQALAGAGMTPEQVEELRKLREDMAGVQNALSTLTGAVDTLNSDVSALKQAASAEGLPDIGGLGQ